MGRANSKFYNDHPEDVQVRTYNAADHVHSVHYGEYTVTSGSTETIYAAADGRGLQACIRFGNEHWSNIESCSNGETYNASRWVSIHRLTINNQTNAQCRFVVTDRNNRNTTLVVDANSNRSYNPLRGAVTVSYINPTTNNAGASFVTHSNATVRWDGTNFS